MQNEYNLKKKAAIISLSVGIGMFFAKMGAFLLTGSAAIFSDAAESVVHVLATSMALISIVISSKPADKSHLYGHGNIEFFSAGIEGLLIIAAAVFIIFTAIMDIIKGTNLKQLDIGVIVISFAGVVNLLLGTYLVRRGKKTNSLTLIADGKHVLTDSYTSIGVIVGISLVMITKFQLLDPIFAIAIALNILVTGYKLMRRSIGGLMAETDKEILKFIDFHLILPYFFTIKESHTEEDEIQNLLEKNFPNSQIKIHFDYCLPELCKFCDYQKCTVRSSNKSITFNWNEEKLTGKSVYMFKQN
ncbi:MAG: cation diffusion facilitator family transporter [Ignavibacteriaceae bacterium]